MGGSRGGEPAMFDAGVAMFDMGIAMFGAGIAMLRWGARCSVRVSRC